MRLALKRLHRAPVTFAGIQEGWRGPAGEIVRTFAVLTTSAFGAGMSGQTHPEPH